VANPCGGPAVTLEGTSLEQPPSQPNGGGFNTSMSVTTVTPTLIGRPGKTKGSISLPGGLPQGIIHLDAPLPNGSTLNIRFLLGIQQTGTFKFYFNVEALP